MNIDQIKIAIANGKIVYWKNISYSVISEFNDLWIVCLNGFKSPLVNSKGQMNEKEKDFFIIN